METLLSLNSDGSLLPENDETRALLGTEPRRFKLLPTSPHLLVGVRTPCEPVVTEDERPVSRHRSLLQGKQLAVIGYMFVRSLSLACWER